jgi:O-antigen/teichoic acid export membrane protein
MGIIQRQSIKHTLVTYLGVGLGAINVLFIYTATLSPEEYGFIQVMLAFTKMAVPFVMLGMVFTAVRFFPQFEDEQSGHQGFLFFLLSAVFGGFLLLVLLDWLIEGGLLPYFFPPSKFMDSYGHYALPWILLSSWSFLLLRYAMNFHRIVVPALLTDLLLKVGAPLLCIGYFYGWLNFQHIMQGFVWLHVLMLAGMLLYLKYLGQLYLRPSWKRFTPELNREILRYSGYGILTSLGAMFLPLIDTFMLGALSGFTQAAIYTIPNFVTNAIDAPRRAIASIATPVINKAWEENNLEKISDLYTRSSLMQTVVGLFLLLGIWLSIDSLYALIPEGPNKELYATGKYVVLILGAARVLDMVTGVNTEIIAYSRHYRFNLYSIALLLVVTVLLNFWLIPLYGFHGAAFATLTSLVLYNLSKFLFIWYKTGLQPFRLPILGVLALAAAAYFLADLLPPTPWILLDIALRSGGFAILFVLPLLYFRLVPDLNDFAEKQWKRIRQR